MPRSMTLPSIGNVSMIIVTRIRTLGIRLIALKGRKILTVRIAVIPEFSDMLR